MNAMNVNTPAQNNMVFSFLSASPQKDFGYNCLIKQQSALPIVPCCHANVTTPKFRQKNSQWRPTRFGVGRQLSCVDRTCVTYKREYSGMSSRLSSVVST